MQVVVLFFLFFSSRERPSLYIKPPTYSLLHQITIWNNKEALVFFHQQIFHFAALYLGCPVLEAWSNKGHTCSVLVVSFLCLYSHRYQSQLKKLVIHAFSWTFSVILLVYDHLYSIAFWYFQWWDLSSGL
jgi:magnesium-transporting ATPase (P-type)